MFRRHIGKGGNVWCGSSIIYMPTSTRSGMSVRGTGLSLAVKIADNKNYSDMHGPFRVRNGGLSVTRWACIAPNYTRARASTSAACLSGKCYIVLDFRRLLAYVRISFPREISTAGYEVPTLRIRRTGPGFYGDRNRNQATSQSTEHRRTSADWAENY